MAESPAAAPALSVVVPVYNGAATVGELVQALRGLVIEGGLEIVLVVDNSPDNSLDVCKELAIQPGAPVTVLSLSRNFGEHNAVMAGLARARGAYTITMENELLALWAEDRKSVLFITHDLEEAIALSDRVVVMSAGPAAGIVADYKVDLPRPRDIADIRLEKAFHEIHRDIWTSLRVEVQKAYAMGEGRELVGGDAS